MKSILLVTSNIHQHEESDKKESRPGVGVGIIIFNREDPTKILMGERIAKDSWGDGEISLPGGHIEMFEHEEDSASRETLEETGLIVQILGGIGFNSTWNEKLNKHYITLFYCAKWISGELETKEPNKCKEWKWVSLDHLPEKMFVGAREIIDLNRHKIYTFLNAG